MMWQMLQVHSITKNMQTKWKAKYVLCGTDQLAPIHVANQFKQFAPSCKTVDCTRFAKLAIAANLPIITLQCLACKNLHLDTQLLAKTSA